MPYVIGVDIGGTFTDCVTADDEGSVTLGKALSTPQDFSIGAIDAVRDAAKNLGLKNEGELLTFTKFFFHACTVGDNTLITRSGAKTGLITTKGFADTLVMMRGRTTDGLTEEETFHVSALSKPNPIVPRSLIAEVRERIDYKGSVLVQLDTQEAERAITGLIAKGAESVGICLLWSISNDKHEKFLAEIIKQHDPSIYISLSSHVAPFLGEYERTATTAFNAYIGPKIAAYLEKLDAALRDQGLKREPLIMQSYGGVLGIKDTCTNAVGTIESGPASGVLGSLFIAKRMGISNILATDMGGTTFKVSVIRDGVVEDAVEKSGGRNLGRYEKWDGGNDFVGMAWSLVGKRPFQLRRIGSPLTRAQATKTGLIGFRHRKTDLNRRPWEIKSAPIKNTKSLTALSRLSNHERGNTVSRKSANRLYSTQPMRKAASVASKDLRQKLSKLKSSFNSLMRFSLSALPAYIRLTTSAAYGTLVTITRYVYPGQSINRLPLASGRSESPDADRQSDASLLSSSAG